MSELLDAPCDKDILRAWAETAARFTQGVPKADAMKPLLVSFKMWGPIIEKLFGKVGSFAYRWDEHNRISVVLIEEGYSDSDLIMMSL